MSPFYRFFIFEAMGLFGTKDKLQIISFRTYGTRSHLYLKGRALEDEEIDLSKKGVFNLFRNSWKRFETDEIRNTPISINLSNRKIIENKTDKKGYYLIDESIGELGELTDLEGWLNFEISYTDSTLEHEILLENRFPGEMLIPAANADYGVISDIDDTILHTGVVSSLKWRAIINTIFKGVVSRKALDGTAKLYHLLHRGPSLKNANPIFYVSHSPWNLYRYLELFLKTNNFPKGPILLRTMSSFWQRNAKDNRPQKQREIMNILKTYPKLTFILIGDCGEKDADIYMKIADQNPEQVLAIYLRNVNSKKRMLKIKELTKGYKTTPLMIANSSEEVIVHATKNGYL